MAKPRTISITPSMGGRLMTGVSSDTAGIANWVVKRDFRRSFDQEVRAEGYDLFAPNTLRQLQPPTTDPITLVAMARRANGDTAVVVGTQGTLWRYFGFENGAYFTPEDGYIVDDYITDNPDLWIEIGTGFDVAAARWEAECINGYLVLNNGSDLPVTYRVEDLDVYPIYELREQGVASVRTISEHNGMLVCCGIRQIKAADLPTVMSGQDPYGKFDDNSKIDDFSWRVIWSMPDEPRRFAAVIPCTVTRSSNIVTLDYPVKSLSTGMQIIIPGAGADGGNLTCTVAYASGATVIVADGAVTAASKSIKDEVDAARDAEQDAIDRLAGAATTISEAEEALIEAYGNTVASPDDTSAQQAEATASAAVDAAKEMHKKIQDELTALTEARVAAEAKLDNVDTALVASDADASVAGYYQDLVDDGSAILKAKTLRGYLVVYKETSIYIGQYTAVIPTPYQFEKLDIPPSSALEYPNTLVSVMGIYHMYAGSGAFYRFDMTNRIPVEVQEMQTCQDLFFESVESEELSAAIPNTEAWAVLNIPQGTWTRQYRWSAEDFRFGRWYQLTETGPRWESTGGPMVTKFQCDSEDNFTLSVVMDITQGQDGPILETQLTNAVLQEFITPGKEAAFAVDNPLTKEIMFCFPSSASSDKILCYDYRFGTVRTSSAHITAAAFVNKPDAAIAISGRQPEKWLVMGTHDGKVLRYGYVEKKPIPFPNATATKAASSSTVTVSGAIMSPRYVGCSLVTASGKWFAITAYVSDTQVTVIGSGAIAGESFSIHPVIYHRNGSAYTSVLQSGMENFGRSDQFKQLTQYCPILSTQSGSATLSIALSEGETPSVRRDAITTTVSAPKTNDALNLVMSAHYLGDTISTNDLTNPVMVAGRMVTVIGGDARAFSRKGE